MGLGDIFKNLVKKEEKKKFESPDVKFMEDDDPTGVTHTIPITVEPHSQQYIIKHNNELLVFNSMEEMPPELREELKHIDETDDFPHSYSVIINGERKQYSSIDEMPEEIRNAINNQ